MVQIASDALGIAPDRIRFQLGDSSYPQAPTQDGSSHLSTVGSAVNDVCVALKKQLAALERKEGAAFASVDPDTLSFTNGEVAAQLGSSTRVSFTPDKLIYRRNLTTLIQIQKYDARATRLTGV